MTLHHSFDNTFVVTKVWHNRSVGKALISSGWNFLFQRKNSCVFFSGTLSWTYVHLVSIVVTTTTFLSTWETDRAVWSTTCARRCCQSTLLPPPEYRSHPETACSWCQRPAAAVVRRSRCRSAPSRLAAHARASHSSARDSCVNTSAPCSTPCPDGRSTRSARCTPITRCCCLTKRFSRRKSIRADCRPAATDRRWRVRRTVSMIRRRRRLRLKEHPPASRVRSLRQSCWIVTSQSFIWGTNDCQRGRCWENCST